MRRSVVVAHDAAPGEHTCVWQTPITQPVPLGQSRSVRLDPRVSHSRTRPMETQLRLDGAQA